MRTEARGLQFGVTNYSMNNIANFDSVALKVNKLVLCSLSKFYWPLPHDIVS